MTDDATKIGLKRGVDCIGVACSFVCHDGDGKFVLQKRSTNARDEHGRWDCGGGALEFGENFEETVRREVFEEYCAIAKDVTLCGTHNVLRDNDGTPTHWVALTFAVRVDPSEVKNGEPHKIDEIGWFTLDTLPSPLHSVVQKDFDCVRAAGIL
ncbi:MAG: NUDIX domain-containing protein [Patescibacteria group bacterium]